MYSKLIQIDRWLFTLVNQRWSNQFFDQLIPVLRDPITWVPLYLFMVLFAILNFPRKAFSWMISLGITASLTDSISSHLIKPFFARPRPCSSEAFMPDVKILVSHCGSNGSFTSSHAANHFGMAMFIFMTLFPIWKSYTYLFFFWAACICFAQLYVGVHYPFDVMGGALLGLIVGWSTGKLYLLKFGSIEIPTS